MSQHKPALDLIEREAGLQGKILRPLSAKLLPETEAEAKGYIDHAALRDIRGRSRKPQIEMTHEFNITNYPCAGGGCLLTDKEFAAKMGDLFEHNKRVTVKEVNQLKVGRHFRYGENKIIVGRNQAENESLMSSKHKGDYYFEVPKCGSPTTLLKGPKTADAIAKAAGLTAFHSDKKLGEVTVDYGTAKLTKHVTITVPSQSEVDALRI
jgi:hypothetical protein